MKRLLCLPLCLSLLLCGCGAATPTATTTTTTTSTTTTSTTTVIASSNTTPTLTSNVTESLSTNTTMEKTTTTTTTSVPSATVPISTTTTTVPTTRTTTTTTKPTTATSAVSTTKTATTTSTRPEKQAPLRVLSIGNSFSKDAHSQLALLAEYEGHELYTLNLFHSGCTLEKHIRMWENDEAGYWTEENGDSRTLDWNKKVRLMDVLPVGEWDIITIQAGVTESCNYDSMIENGKKLRMLIKSKQPKAKVYIHQTWSLPAESQHHNEQTGGTLETMWPKAKANYDRLSEELGLPQIPVGLAMYNLQKSYDARGLGESVYRDNLHADEGWGCFLIALVWYRTLTGDVPSSDFDMLKGPYIEDPVTRKLVYDTAMAAVEAYM